VIQGAHWFLIERDTSLGKSRIRLLKDYRRTIRKEKDLGHARRLLRFKAALVAAQVPPMTLEAFRKNYNVVFHEESLTYNIEQRAWNNSKRKVGEIPT
jgi:hypothetical protein